MKVRTELIGQAQALLGLAIGVCALQVAVVLQFASHEMKHSLGKFRISATADDRDAFADGKANGGDVDANWVVLRPSTARTLSSFTELVIATKRLATLCATEKI